MTLGDIMNAVEDMNKEGVCGQYYVRTASMFDSVINTIRWNRWNIYWADFDEPQDVGAYVNQEFFIDRNWTAEGDSLENFLESLLHEMGGHPWGLSHGDMGVEGMGEGERGEPESCSFET